MALVPLGVVTVTSMAPVVPAGETAVIWLAELTMKLVAATVPKLTALASVKLAPLKATAAPPAGKPAGGLTALTVGTAS
jgi:hypothetical protein